MSQVLSDYEALLFRPRGLIDEATSLEREKQAQLDEAIYKATTKVETEFKPQLDAISQEGFAVSRSIGACALVNATLNEDTGRFETDTSIEGWVNNRHSYLSKSWAQYGVEIPNVNELQPSLRNAHEIIASLASLRPDTIRQWGVVLIPPASVVGWPIKDAVGYKANKADISKPKIQSSLANRDQAVSEHIDDEFKRYTQVPADSRDDWRIVVAHLYSYQDPTMDIRGRKGIEKFLAEKQYSIGPYDTRALGCYEHASLILQDKNIHSHGSLLLKDYQGGDLFFEGTGFEQLIYQLLEGDELSSADYPRKHRFVPAIEA